MAQISIKGKIEYRPFPAEEYQLIGELPSIQGSKATKYKIPNQQTQFLLLTHTLKQIPEKIKSKIIVQIERINLFQSNVLIPSIFYVYEDGKYFNLSLRVENNNKQTLKQVIQANQQQSTLQQKIEVMKFLVNILTGMHIKNQPHGYIKLQNIFQTSESYFALGLPLYYQIQKWKFFSYRKTQVLQNQKVEEQAYQRPSLYLDIWNLGIVFLQIWLNQEFPLIINAQDAQMHAAKIKDNIFRKMIQGMICSVQQRLKISDVNQILKEWKPSSTQPAPVQVRKVTRFSLFEEAFIPENNGGAEFKIKPQKSEFALQIGFRGGKFMFHKNRAYLGILTGLSKQAILLDCTYNLMKMVSIDQQMTYKVLKSILRDDKTTARLTQNGFLQLSYRQQTVHPQQSKAKIKIKSQIVKAQKLFDKLCMIKGKYARRGFILAEKFVITSAWDKQDLKTNQKYLAFEGKYYKGNNENDYQMWIASEETEEELPPTFDFCFFDFKGKINMMHFGRYQKLIKNYSEEIIQQKIKEVKEEDLRFHYQIGGKILQKDRIFFGQNFFKLDLPSNHINELLIGEPLIICLPFSCNAVIGLYSSQGAGFLFTDEFYWNLYRMIVKCRGEQQILISFLPFIFIECSQLNIREGDMICLNMRFISFFIKKNNLDTKAVYLKIQEFKVDQQNNGKQIGFYNFILFRKFQNSSPQKALYHLKQAYQHYFSFYQGSDNYICALLSYLLAINLSQMFMKKQDIIFYLWSAVDILKRCCFNPFVLENAISIYMRFQSSQKLQSLKKDKIYLCKALGLRANLKSFYQSLINFLKAENPNSQQLQKYQSDLNTLQSNFYTEKSFRLQRLLRRTQKSIKYEEFSLINELLQELLTRQLRQTPPDVALKQTIKELWRSAICIFMERCTSLEKLTVFQKITYKFYDDDGYYQKFKECFLRKKKIIKEQSQRQ